MTVRRRVAILLALMGSLAGACVTHPPLGGSVRAALHAQAAAPKKPTGSVEGLDSQEAAIIARSYHKSLAPKGEAAPSENVILVAPQSSSGRQAQPLAPSVPKER